MFHERARSSCRTGIPACVDFTGKNTGRNACATRYDRSMRVTIVWLCLASSMFAADNPEIPLWAGGAPGSEGKTAKEVDEAPNKDHAYFKVTGVHNPSLTVYLPPREKAT